MKLVRVNARKQVKLWTYIQHTLTLSNLLCYYSHELRKSDRPILVRAAESKAGLKNGGHLRPNDDWNGGRLWPAAKPGRAFLID
jgi:hypothetical protein